MYGTIYMDGMYSSILEFVFRIGGSTIRMLLVVATLVYRFNSIYWNERIMRGI